jgi:hypothetical protein
MDVKRAGVLGVLLPSAVGGAQEFVLTTTAGKPALENFGVALASSTRWQQKADALSGAWRAKYGVVLGWAGTVLALGVAQHETWCGDAWPGEHNWGAVQYRTLHPQEQQVLTDAGLHPDPRSVSAARAALAAAVAAGHVVADPAGALHVDSSPGLRTTTNPGGWYWVYFRAFGTDEEGAECFVTSLTRPKPTGGTRGILEAAQTPADGQWGAQAHVLAAEMYAPPGYYEGVHDPTQPGGKEANVADYSTAVASAATTIAAGLAGWVAGGQQQLQAVAEGALAEQPDPGPPDPPADPSA